MTDTVRLKQKMADSGLKQSHIAEELGITYAALVNKVSNKNEFKASEIKTLCRILNITSLKDKEAIFFTD